VCAKAASEQLEGNKNGKTLRNKTSEPVIAAGHWWSRIARRERQQGNEVTQLHQTIKRMARIQEAHAVQEEVQWLGMRDWMEHRETKRNVCHEVNVLCRTGIGDQSMTVQAKAGVCEAVPRPGSEQGWKSRDH
jgi:hypothetical protein